MTATPRRSPSTGRTLASNLWTGKFGDTLQPRGSSTFVNPALQVPGKVVFGGGDVDVDVGSTGTIHATSLVYLVKPSLFETTPPNQFHAIAQLGVAAFTINQNGGIENAQLLDTTDADRPWITSDGPHVWISYYDAGNSALIHVQRSDDDGLTWHTRR